MKKINNKTVLAAYILVSMGSWQANAQEAGFSAEIDSRLTYDDNILRTTDEFAESDTSAVVAPELTFAGIFGKQRFSAVYVGEYAKYFDNNDVDYDDHNVRLRADLDHSTRLTSRFEISYLDQHEDFDDVNDIFNGLTEFNHYTQSQISGRIAYGRQDSFGQLVLGLGTTSRDYDNNDQEYRSFERDLASLAFYYRIAPRTRLLAEVVYQDYEYDPDASFTDLDNEYVTYQAGIEWALTNQIEGTIKVGLQERDYGFEALQDIDGLAYEANIDYRPNTFTNITLSGRRESLDSSIDSLGGFLRTSFGLAAEHELTELVSIDADLGYINDEFVFSGTREDKRYAASIGLDYAMLTWVVLGVNYAFNERNSSLDTADFESNSINFTVNIALD